MSKELPITYLARYSETAWSLTGLPLTVRGEHAARRFRERLRGLTFAKVFMALALTLFSIAPALAAQEQVIADKPTADKAASAPLTIQQKTDAVQASLNKIRGRLALLPSDEARAPPEVMTSEWTEYRRLLNLLVNTYESHIDSLNKLNSIRNSHQDFQEKSSAWQGFPKPGPYSVDFVDDLWDKVQAKDREIKSVRLEKDMFSGLLEAQRVSLTNSGQALRRAKEALQTAAKDTLDRARWLMELSELRNLYDQARMAALDSEREYHQEMLAYRIDERTLLERQAFAASRASPLSKEDRDANLANLDQLQQDLEHETQQALEKDKAIQSQLIQVRTHLREALERSTMPSQNAAETHLPDTQHLQQELDTVTVEAQASSSNLNVLRLLDEAQVGRRQMWGLRYHIEHAEDIKTLDDAQVDIQQGLNHLSLRQEYLRSDLDMARRRLEDQQKRLIDWKPEYGDYALGQRQWLAYSQQETALRRVVAETDNLDASLLSLQELLRWQHEKSSLNDRLQGFYVKSLDLAAALWDFELLTIEDKIILEGHEVINKSSVTVGKILRVLLILGIGFWLTSRIVDYGGRQIKRRLPGRESASLLGLRLFSLFMAVGLIIVALVRAHIPLTVFTFFGGALAIGIGFGAQNIINNYISGLILLAERTIKLGDIVEVDSVLSRVTKIGSRCCQVHRFDGIDMLIPNSSFLEKNVTNWTLSDQHLRCTVTVGVAYGSPARSALALVERAAAEHPQVLKDPAPDVYLQEFADSALSFRLDFWVDLAVQSNRLRVMSDVRLHIDELFAQNGIVIAFPQRDVHLDLLNPIKVELTTAASGAMARD
jgi:small-conductance mechanosensitive channel